jgi:hypothetical protein
MGMVYKATSALLIAIGLTRRPSLDHLDDDFLDFELDFFEVDDPDSLCFDEDDVLAFLVGEGFDPRSPSSSSLSVLDLAVVGTVADEFRRGRGGREEDAAGRVDDVEALAEAVDPGRGPPDVTEADAVPEEEPFREIKSASGRPMIKRMKNAPEAGWTCCPLRNSATRSSLEGFASSLFPSLVSFSFPLGPSGVEVEIGAGGVSVGVVDPRESPVCVLPTTGESLTGGMDY